MSSEQRPSKIEITGRLMTSFIFLPGRSTQSAVLEAAIDGIIAAQHLPKAIEGDPLSIATLVLGVGAARVLRWAYTGGMTYHGGGDYRAHF